MAAAVSAGGEPTFKHWSEVPDAKADWVKIAREEEGNFGYRLNYTTCVVLRTIACSAAPFAELNQIDIYHALLDQHARPMLEEFEQHKKAPDNWASKGMYPGIWCGLFNPINALSRHDKPAVLKFTFKANYKIFDTMNPDHLKMWETWKTAEANLNKKNAWKESLSDEGIPLDIRMHGFPYPLMAKFTSCPIYKPLPDHVEFYRENHFGACIGYSDVMGLVVVLPECIDSVKQIKT